MNRILRWPWLLAALLAFTVAAAAEDPANLEQLRTSAQRGDHEAMLELAILYEYGFRLKDHNPPALAWYRLAAEAGNTKAGARHDALKAKMSAKELDEASKLYAEYAAGLRRPAPAAGTPLTTQETPVTLPATK
jgi:TPR repeat protein